MRESIRKRERSHIWPKEGQRESRKENTFKNEAEITFLASPSLILFATSITLVPFSNFLTELSGKITLIIYTLFYIQN